MRYRSVGEEAIVEERAFEREVDQRVETLPDEKDAEFGRSGWAQKTKGGEVGECEEYNHREKGNNGRLIDDRSRMGRHCMVLHVLWKLDSFEESVKP